MVDVDRASMSDPAIEINEAQAAIEDDFALFDDVRDKIEYIIDLGKDLPPLPAALKTEGNRVRGCQSQVWLVAELDPATRRMALRADSDAVIVKGLISLLFGSMATARRKPSPPTRRMSSSASASARCSPRAAPMASTPW